MTDRDLADFAKPFDRVEKRYFQVTSRVWRLWPNRWAAGRHPTQARPHPAQTTRVLFRLATVCVTAMHRER